MHQSGDSTALLPRQSHRSGNLTFRAPGITSTGGDASCRQSSAVGEVWAALVELYDIHAVSGSCRAMALRSRACGGSNASRHGQAEAIAILIRRTLTWTSAPIFNSFSRIVPQVASANCVWASTSRRKRRPRSVGQKAGISLARGAGVNGFKSPARCTRARHQLTASG